LVGLSLKQAADEISVSEKLISDWENNLAEPTLKHLEDLSQVYGREIDYFLRQTPEPPTGIKFRGKPLVSLQTLPKPAKTVLARLDELCRTSLEFEGLLKKKHDVTLFRVRPTTAPEAAARQIRQTCTLADKPVPNLKAILERLGVRVFEIPIPDDGLSGFSFWHQNYGPCILVHAGDTRGRRNFTLAHELAHLLYGHGSSACSIPADISRSRERIEQKANHFAVELLLPRTGVSADYQKRNLPKRPPEDQLQLMAGKWAVSIQALGYRLEQLGLMERGLTDKMMEQRPPFFRRPKVPTWERRLGTDFVQTCIEAYKTNLISIGKLAHTLQIPIRKAMEIVEKTVP
jgi:Zn-dependent peptidase ImmA (M78 family)